MKKYIFVWLALILTATVVCADKPESHDKMWQYTHGMKAKQDIASCTVCHTNEKTCLDCHKVTFDSKSKPRSHNGDYTIVHRLDAKRDASVCSTCHERGGDYCNKCHQSLNKAVSTTNASPTQPQSHDAANWRTALHGAYAKRNLSACQACHPDLYTVSPCTLCHGGATNIAGSPHPANFKASQFKDLTVCYKCHGTGTSAGPSAGPLTL
jgi:hypothetical protein